MGDERPKEENLQALPIVGLGGEELEGGPLLRMQDAVSMALAELCVRVHSPKPCSDDGVVMLLWHPSVYSPFHMLCSTAREQG